ncbi:MAG: hypothetical protein IJZ90_00060 [Clostridia bacterium]|nr:hypothetical protein [Clostridia bacterium]
MVPYGRDANSDLRDGLSDSEKNGRTNYMADKKCDRYSEKINDEIDNRAAADNARADYQKNRELRKQKRIESEWLRSKAVVVVLVLTAILLVCSLTAVFIFKSVKGEDRTSEVKGNVVAVDGEEFYDAEFRLFCSMVVESSSFEEMAAGNSDYAALSETVKANAVSYIEEFVCKLHEAKKAGVSFTAEEKETLRTEITSGGYANDKYYLKYYGMTYDEYFEFCSEMKLVDKYVNYVSDSADLSEDAQKSAYSEHEKELSSAEVQMIYLDISGLNEEEASFKRTNAETFVNFISQEGMDISELIPQWSDENDLFDVGHYKTGVSFTVDNSTMSDYPKLCTAIFEMDEGELKIIETENEICVVRCEKKNGFEEIAGSDELIAMTKYEYVLGYFEKIMASGTYFAKVNNEVYDGIDITPFVQSAADAYLQEE